MKNELKEMRTISETSRTILNATCEDEEEAGTSPTLSIHVLEGPSEIYYWRTRNPEGRPSLQPGGNEVNSEF